MGIMDNLKWKMDIKRGIDKSQWIIDNSQRILEEELTI